MTDIEAIKILKQMKADTPVLPYECLMNTEMEALETILLGYEVMCNEVKRLKTGAEAVRDKLELMDYYGGIDALKELNELLGDEYDD